MSSEQWQVALHPNDRPRFEEAKDAVAEEIGENPTNGDVVRELMEAYLGGDALGRWRQ